VVVYGRFGPIGGRSLDVLPFRPRPAAPEVGTPATAWSSGLFSNLGADGRFAAYWRRTRPGVLGIVSRPLDAREQARLSRLDGVVVEAVTNGSPAESAGIAAGDVLVAVDGKPLGDPLALPALLGSLAGNSVRIDLIRDGRPLSVGARLNSATP
jgi:membrane-associated protease RseP (regulator of RpoE activity)